MKIKLTILCLSLCVLCFNLKSQTIRYVKPVSSGTGDGSSWANASSDLQAIINASSANNQIWVATGVYKPTQDALGNSAPTDLRDRTFHLKDSVIIYGGFVGTETLFSQRDFNANICRLSGDFNADDIVTGNGSTLSITGNAENAYHVVLSVGDAVVTILDGFTISGGYAQTSGTINVSIEGRSISRNEGAGINITNCKTVISNCILENNKAQLGGGINANSSPTSISYCKFYRNIGSSSGGGIRINLANTVLSYCYFEGNNAGHGGGLTIATCSAQILYSTFYQNFSSTEGGGIHANSGNISPKIHDCVLNQNTAATLGSAICFTSAGNILGEIFNCTVTNNTAGNNGGAVTANGVSGTCAPKIRNCIIWGNLGTGTQGIVKITTAVPSVGNTIVQGGFGGAGTCINCPGTTGNIDPQFKNTANINGIDNILGTSDDGIFLKSTSPAINAGDLTIVNPIKDITGFSRINRFDLGAYEFRCLETSSTTNITICSSDLPYTWNGFIYTVAGTHLDTIPNIGGCDSVLTLNLTVNNVTMSTTDITICNVDLPYTWNSLVFNSAGSQTATLVNSNGCDSLATLNLTVNNSSASTTDLTICSSELPHVWNGLTFNSAGSQTATLTNSAGCDSLATLNLSVINSSTSTTDLTICSSQLPYTWNNLVFNAAGSQTDNLVNAEGCDSLATLNLTVLNSSTSTTDLTLCSYDMPYTWNNIVFIGPGSQTASLTNSVGCDSVATLNLSVIDPTYLSITAFDETLIADEVNATYQWISCDSTTNGNIPGETNQSFTATVNGNYAVIVTTTTCSDTSGCFNIASVGIKTQERAANKITISPNPNNGNFTIDLKAESKIIITDALGRKVFEKTLQVGKQKVDLQNENNGVYLIHLIGNNYSQTGKLILNK